MKLSARNQLPGTVVEVSQGAVNGIVKIEVAPGVIITSSIKNIPQYTCDAVERFLNGEIPWGTNEMLGLKENGVTIAKNEFYEKLLSQESRDYVDAEWQKVISGEVTPLDTVGMSTEEVEQIRQAAKP